MKTSDPDYIAACEEWLEGLLKDFFRTQTIQDVGFWLVEHPLSPLPPRLTKVLKPWLEEHNGLTIKQFKQGSPVSDLRDYIPLITRMHQETGLPIEAACKLICERLSRENEDGSSQREAIEIDPQVLRRTYDRSMTPYERLSNDSVKAAGAFNKSGTPLADMLKAKARFEKNLKKRKNRTQKPDL